ncbi:MAG: hypothetical protein JW990_07690 [Thermoleophilia bacterium]|nr:hypothetical protein [Thermoleophilia bacterium]
MGLFDRLRLRESDGYRALSEENREALDSLEFFQERMAELELALEDLNWVRLSFESEQEFSRDGLKRIVALSRLMFLKNPLINRAVTLQAMYVWGQGISIEAKHPAVDAAVQAFLDDEKNKAELTGHQARTLKEQDLQTEGNLFFVFFCHRYTGRVRVRTIPLDEIEEIITSPDDRKEPWYYKRVWSSVELDYGSGAVTVRASQTVYYPDWRYNPTPKPDKIGGHPVMWDTPVYHVKVGGLSGMRFGVPETYSGLDWARAYKEFLEDWATIVRAYSRFAFNLTTKGGKKGLAAAKAKLGTTAGTSRADTNPPPVAGAVFAAGDGRTLEPIRTAGATTKAEDGRRMLLMVAAATGLPETFFGDIQGGTLATAKSLDRPTELKFSDRQELWISIHQAILNYVIDKRALAVAYRDLQGVYVIDDEGDDGRVVLTTRDPETGDPIDRHIDIDFPSILEHDKAADVDAIVRAATLDGKAPAGTMDPKTVSRLLLTALGQDDIDDLLDEIFPEDEEGQVTPEAEAAFIEAVRDLRALVESSERAS